MRPRSRTISRPSPAVSRAKRAITRAGLRRRRCRSPARCRARARFHSSRWRAGRARLGRAHRLERLAHHPLELGQRGDAAVLVAHRREVADLGERDQPLVALVLVRDGAEQVDVGRRGQPLERRSSPAARAPSARPSSGAGRARRCAPSARPSRVALEGQTSTGPRRGGREDATRATSAPRQLGDQRPQRRRGRRLARVEVDEQRLALRQRRGVGASARSARRQVVGVAERRGDVVAHAVVLVARRARTARRRRAAARPRSSVRIR